MVNTNLFYYHFSLLSCLFSLNIFPPKTEPRTTMQFQASFIKARVSLSPALNCPKQWLGLSRRHAIHKGLPYIILPAASYFSLLLQIEIGPPASEKSRKVPGPLRPHCPGSAIDKQTERPCGKTQQCWKMAAHSVLWLPYVYIVKKGKFCRRGSGPHVSCGGWVKPGWGGWRAWEE